MITIIFGVVIGIIGLYTMFDGNTGEDNVEMLLGVILILFGCICIGGGMYRPLNGYTEWELVSKTELDTLADKNNLEKENTIFTEDIEKNASIEIIQDENCKNSAFYEYTRRGKKTIWTFAINTQETKYVLYMPVEKNQEDISLG